MEVDGYKPPKNSKPKDLFSSRFKNALKGEMRIRGTKKISVLNKSFKVANSDRGKITYTVTVTNTPKCTCTDFQKNKSKVVCSPFIFVLVAALNGTNLQNQLRNRYVGNDDVKALVVHPVATECLQPNTKERLTR